MAAKKKWCAHTKGKANAKEYDLIIKATCDELGWEFPEKEVLVLADYPDPQARGCPSYFMSPKRNCRRTWRHDYLFRDKGIAVEVDGIGPHGTRNRHQSFTGYTQDCLKHNAMNVMSLTLLRYTPALLREGKLLEDLLFLKGRTKGD